MGWFAVHEQLYAVPYLGTAKAEPGAVIAKALCVARCAYLLLYSSEQFACAAAEKPQNKPAAMIDAMILVFKCILSLPVATAYVCIKKVKDAT